MKMLSKMKLIPVLAFVTFLVMGCGADHTEETDGSGEVEGTSNTEELSQELTVVIDADPTGLSPLGISDVSSYVPVHHMYETLFERDPETGDIVPVLATGYENPDDTTWIFELREGVEFHDGTPFNAEAVKYSFEKMVDPETASPSSHLLSFMETVEVVDEYTVELTTREPHADVLAVLTTTSLSIVSPTANEEQDLMEDPVGTGPFKFESWNRGDRIVMTGNENYWGEVPVFNTVTFVNVPDSSTAISMLETGEVDLIGHVEVDDASRVESIQDVTLLQVEGSRAQFYTFNMEKEPMNEIEFRQAVAMGINAQEYVDQLDGTGIYSSSLFGPAVINYDESIEASGYDYDPDAAREIVKENGYDAHDLTMYTTADREEYRKIAEVVEAQLSEINLNVSIEMMEWATFLDETAEGKQDMFVYSTSNSMTGLETFNGYFHTNGLGGNNRSQYSNPEFDEIVSEARSTLDEDDRQVLINQAHELLIDEAVLVPIYHANNMLAFNNEVEGVKVFPNRVFSVKEAYKE